MTAPSTDRDRPELTRVTQAASALIQALGAFEDLCEAAQRTRLSTEKNVMNVAKGIQQAITSQETIDACLRTLMEAVQSAQMRHAWNIESLKARAAEVQRRAGEITDMQARYGQLGREVCDLNERLKAAIGGNAEGNGEQPDRHTRMSEVRERMVVAMDRAVELREAANGAEMFDIAREAETLRGSIESARNSLDRLLGA